LHSKSNTKRDLHFSAALLSTLTASTETIEASCLELFAGPGVPRLLRPAFGESRLGTETRATRTNGPNVETGALSSSARNARESRKRTKLLLSISIMHSDNTSVNLCQASTSQTFSRGVKNVRELAK